MDPDAPSNGFATCSNHGTWDRVAYRCNCDVEWALRDTGLLGIGNEAVMTCDVCSGFYGPVPVQDAQLAPHCRKVWTADPLTGDLSECSGHGAYRHEAQACVCDGSSVKGFWVLETVSGAFDELVYAASTGNAVTTVTTTRSAQSCVACKTGYGPDPALGSAVACNVKL